MPPGGRPASAGSLTGTSPCGVPEAGLARFHPVPNEHPPITITRGPRSAARSGPPPMWPGADLPYTWRGPYTTPAYPALPPAHSPAAVRDRFSHTGARTRTTARPPRRRQPPATFRLTTGGPRPRHTPASAVSDLDPDNAVCGPDRDRDRNRLPLRARAAVLDAVPESLTSSAASSRTDTPARAHRR